MKGGDIELDRTIIDKLGEPLVHLLRNAVDHGVEKRGVVQLRAERQRDLVSIVVENEGRVVDWEEIVEAAVQRNIISKQMSGKFSKKGI